MHQDFSDSKDELGVVAHTCNSSTWEAEVGGQRVQGQPALHNETYLKKKEKRKII
jgi:hypothetical protein